jgi:membrane protein YqaA with SNARE-associated domain
MEQLEEEESKSGFLLKNLVRGLIWFAVILVAFLLLENYLQENFQHTIEAIYDKPFIFYSVFTVSEVTFGLVPPEFFMMVWILHKVPVTNYVVGLSILTLLSYLSGIAGYFIGKNFSKTALFSRIHSKYLVQYEKYLKKYGGYLVFVGAVTPVPYSATCMLAGTVNFNFKEFLLIGISRIVRFFFYGWMVWASPGWADGIL